MADAADGGGGGDDVALSIEETNALRAKLGLKPLSLGTETSATQQAHDNFSRLKAEREAEAEKAALAERLERARQRRLGNVKLEGESLGAADDDVDDSLKWIERSRRRQVELAAEAADRAAKARSAPVAEYTAKDLKGLRVGHSRDHFDDEHEEILVLKDSTILDNEAEGDELVSLRIAESERRERNLKNMNALARVQHDAYDDQSGSSKILSQYDDEPEQESFSLGAFAVKKKRREVKSAAKKQSLDYQTTAMDDYVSPQEMQLAAPTFKKVSGKKRPKKVRKQLTVTDDDSVPMSISSNAPIDNSTTSFVDDDDLQAALARNRSIIVQNRSRDILLDLQKDVAASGGEAEEKPKQGAIVISETSEFVRNLTSAAEQTAMPDSGTVKFTKSTADPEVTVKETDDRMETDETHIEGKEEEAVEEGNELQQERVVILEEPELNKGIGTALELMRQKGFIESVGHEEATRDQRLVEQQKWLLKRRFDEGKAQKAGASMKKREYEDMRLRDSVNRYKDYNPEVNLNYTDEFGRALSTKEAWKQICHRFHGNDSGKRKTEKRLKKIAEEQKAMRIGSTDAHLGFVSSVQSQQKQLGHAHIVLTGSQKIQFPSPATDPANSVGKKG